MKYQLVHYASVVAGIFPVVFLLKAGWANLNTPLRILLIYALIAFSIDVFTAIVVSSVITPTIHNVFTIVEYVSVVTIYFYFENDPKPLNLFLALTIGFLIFYIVGHMIEVSFHVNNYIGSTAEAFVITFLSIRYYFKYVEQFTVTITQHRYYWFNLAFMIYFSAAIFIFLFSKVILSPNDIATARNFWVIHSVSNVVYNTLLATGVYKWRKLQISRL